MATPDRLDQARALLASNTADVLAMVPADRQERVGAMLYDLRASFLFSVYADEDGWPSLEEELTDSVALCRASLPSITEEVRSTSCPPPDSPTSPGDEGCTSSDWPRQ